MTKDLADALCGVMDDEGAEYDRLDDYSGRGMFGEATVGLVLGDENTLMRACMRAARSWARDDDADKFIREALRLRRDSFGRSDIIVY